MEIMNDGIKIAYFGGWFVFLLLCFSLCFFFTNQHKEKSNKVNDLLCQVTTKESFDPLGVLFDDD